jgi:hypothetical protein
MLELGSQTTSQLMFTSRSQCFTILRVYCGHGLALDYSGRSAEGFFSTLVSTQSAAALAVAICSRLLLDMYLGRVQWRSEWCHRPARHCPRSGKVCDKINITDQDI